MNNLKRFFLRDILWLTVAIGLALGWWLGHRRLAWQADEADKVVSMLLAGQKVYRTLLERHAPPGQELGIPDELPTIEELREMYGR